MLSALHRLVLAVLFAWPTLASAGDDASTAWLVTYGPGEVYWQRFGHNAIWIRDPGRGLDHVFNFGFFDFAQEDFFLRFLQGRMLYFSAARPAQQEFADYIDENRSIRAQRLDLSAPRLEWLTAFLLNEVQPENRDYLYDYYRNNCSTRVRDALDAALDGELSRNFQGRPASQNWRDHTRRLTIADFWLYLGLEIVLGAPVDAPIDRWKEMFIPATLASALETLATDGGATGLRPVVAEDVLLFASTASPPPERPRGWWPRYLLSALGVLAIAALLSRWAGPRVARGLARSWLTLGGLAGLAMLFFWFGTDHAVAAFNLNLLVLNPLWLWPAFAPAGRRAGLGVIAAFAAVSLVLLAVPGGQYNADVLAALLPLNLAAGWALARRRG